MSTFQRWCHLNRGVGEFGVLGVNGEYCGGKGDTPPGTIVT